MQVWVRPFRHFALTETSSLLVNCFTCCYGHCRLSRCSSGKGGWQAEEVGASQLVSQHL